jgi:hypothetical protein
MWHSTLLLAVAVGVVLGVLPRSFLMNDDEGLLTHLRAGTVAPFMSPLLSEFLGRLYAARPDIAWYGWWLYGVHALSLHVLLRAIDLRVVPGARDTADDEQKPQKFELSGVVAALAVTAAVIGLMATLTFTIAAMLACGTALLAATATVANSSGSEKRLGWWFLLGVLFVVGFVTRRWSVVGALVGAAPLGGWLLWRVWAEPDLRKNLTVAALALFVMPLLLARGSENEVPSAKHEPTKQWLAYNLVRGKIHQHAAFRGLEHRGPDVLEKAGWSESDWRSFWNWLFVDEERFSVERISAIRDSGGVAVPIRVTFRRYVDKTLGDGQARKLAVAAVLCAVFAAVGVFGSRGLFLFAGSYLAFFAFLSVALPTFSRFPYHVSQPMLLLVTAGVWVVARHEGRDSHRFRDLTLGLLLLIGTVVPFMQTWPKYLPDRTAQVERRAFHERVGERYSKGAFIVVYGGGGAVAMDPLDAAPRPYEYTGLGWSVFSVPFYRSLNPLGISKGAQLFDAMARRDNAFIVTDSWRTKHLRQHFKANGRKWRLLERDGQGKGSTRVALLQIVPVPGD